MAFHIHIRHILHWCLFILKIGLIIFGYSIGVKKCRPKKALCQLSSSYGKFVTCIKYLLGGKRMLEGRREKK